MTVRMNQIDSTTDTGNMPTTSANTYTFGMNTVGGGVEYLVFRYDMTFAASPTTNTGLDGIVQACRIVINGETCFDFRAGYTAGGGSDVATGIFSYFLNSIGGRAYEVPLGTTTREGYWGIPIGRVLPNGTNRVEVVLEFAATDTGATISSGSLQTWFKYNTAFQRQTTVVPSTSYIHSANALESVIVRVPSNINGVVSAILVQNDSAEDGFNDQAIRVNAISDFSFEASMWRWLNGDMANGIMSPSLAVNDNQSFLSQVKGAMILPVFDLTGGDIQLFVGNGASQTTRTYTPIITAPVGSKQVDSQRQLAKATGNTAKVILDKTEN